MTGWSGRRRVFFWLLVALLGAWTVLVATVRPAVDALPDARLVPMTASEAVPFTQEDKP